ncbi:MULTISPECIES: bifunctional DNA primase/polymerase [Mycolicibacterium]|uniref:bifunctional DNA primase/polymerase n=1 Tax=Mycolicibacterium TaxID=1866885 RepID=UPI0006886225|nr:MULTISPECIES: bifunctional DNA primase/polymerase [Mycolicibacterium]QZY45072.1 bifunctional DNA primase/polymerase [Mycolicibacterium austroafricanum]UJL28870.1 bifunctional DNA primase/polymerase [Mycolicibacterium vanbaalenii]WND55584.1 bifunctional DNA primase/polymerase [Mycolicibacterium vanbaalenii]
MLRQEKATRKPLRDRFVDIGGGLLRVYFENEDNGLCLPDVSGLSLLEAALAYAEAGWYVLPTDPANVKNPGSVVGGKWQEHSSRDPEQIRRWWTANPHYGIALHCGRSGAGVFDLDEDLNDRPADMPDELWAALQSGAIQATRRPGCGKDARAHYMFACEPDTYGNSAGAFTRWGQFRGRNGVIIAAPTPHPDAETKDGEYRPRKTGPLPPMPDVLRDCLSEAGETADPLTDVELSAFLDAHTGEGCGRDGCSHVVDGPVKNFRTAVEDGASRYETLVKVAPWALSEGMAGCYSARELVDALRTAYFDAFGEGDGRTRLAQRSGEFARVMRWGAAQADINRAHRNDSLPTAAELESFWTSRPELTRLRQFARARSVGPWSMLGAVLARAIATIPPHVVLPPTVGSFASVNLFVALVAPSGFGKNTSEAAAADFVVSETDVFVATPGSGEGIPKQYAYKQKAEQINLRNAVMFTVGEVDTFAALAGRSGSTLMPELRKAWMGERLGFGYANAEKAVVIMEHRYRMTMIVGVQPGRARALLDDKDGGTPQRFIWLPTTDADAPEEPDAEPDPLRLPAWPAAAAPEPASAIAYGSAEDGIQLKFGEVDPYMLDVPVEKSAFHVLALPLTVAEKVRQEQRAKLRGEVSASHALDSHAMLARLKLAVALMWINGRTDKVSEEDWDLAGLVMGVSTETRRDVQAALRSKSTAANQERGRQDAVREVAKAEVLAKAEDAAIGRVAERIRKLLRANNDQSKAAMRRDFGRDKRLFDPALERLIDVGDVELQPIPGKGGNARAVHIKDGR